MNKFIYMINLEKETAKYLFKCIQPQLEFICLKKNIFHNKLETAIATYFHCWCNMTLMK